MHCRCVARLMKMGLTRTGVRYLGAAAVETKDNIDRFAQFHPTTLSLQNFIDFGGKNASESRSFRFLSKELPVRLANIMKEFYLLPPQLLSMPSVGEVEQWYQRSFEEMVRFENAKPDNPDTLRRFNEALDLVQNRHSTVVETMAQGILELKEKHRAKDGSGEPEIPEQVENCIQYFLDRFYMSRISIRMLIHHHLFQFSSHDRKKQFLESLDTNLNVRSIIQDAYENARFLCEQYYATAPDCDIICQDPYGQKAGDAEIIMTYFPSHLHHIMFELIKNALRAVVECHQGKPTLPKVRVLICKGHKDITIKLSDQGGGIRRSELDLLFNYMYSTAPQPPSPDAADSTPLAGYGYGLPLSRLYAKYFNGDLWLNSVDGFGTDAMVCLKLFPRDASELLPVYNTTSLARYTQATQVADWSDPSHSTAGFRGNGSGNGFRNGARGFRTSSF